MSDSERTLTTRETVSDDERNSQSTRATRKSQAPASQKTKVRKADNAVCLIEWVSLANALEYCHVISRKESETVVGVRILSCRDFSLSSSAGFP